MAAERDDDPVLLINGLLIIARIPAGRAAILALLGSGVGSMMSDAEAAKSNANRADRKNG